MKSPTAFAVTSILVIGLLASAAFAVVRNGIAADRIAVAAAQQETTVQADTPTSESPDRPSQPTPSPDMASEVTAEDARVLTTAMDLSRPVGGLERLDDPAAAVQTGQSANTDLGVVKFANGPLGVPDTTRVIVTVIAPTNATVTLDQILDWNTATSVQADEASRTSAEVERDGYVTDPAANLDRMEEVSVEGAVPHRVQRAMPGFEELFFEQPDGSIVNILVKGPMPPEGIVAIAEALEG